MSIRLGQIAAGTHYQVEIDADPANNGMTFAMVGWQPAPGSEAESYPMRVAAGQSGTHALVCPAATLYYVIEIKVDVPDNGGKATLTFTGLNGPKPSTAVQVTQDETYWVEIV